MKIYGFSCHPPVIRRHFDICVFCARTHELLNSGEFLTLIFAVFHRSHKTLTQCMIHNKLFSIVTRHEITISDVIFGMEFWKHLFKVQLKMAFVVICSISKSKCFH